MSLVQRGGGGGGGGKRSGGESPVGSEGGGLGAGAGSGAGSSRKAPAEVRGPSPRKILMVVSVSLFICNERKQGKKSKNSKQ